MKKFLSFLFVCICIAGTAQQNNVEWCGTMKVLKKYLDNHPNAMQLYLDEMQQTEQETATPARVNASTIWIPVVFHVIHNGDAIGVGENISDAQINSQIDVLNEDFSLTNPNRIKIPAEFLTDAGNANIQFCLAQFDESGNPTNGIIRHDLGQVGWDQTDIENTVKPSTIWNHTKYLNVWVMNFTGSLATDGVLAYSQFPGPWGGSASTDGVAIRYNVVGRVGTLMSGYNKGRSLGHEIGHWFNLFHIWGDDGGACGGVGDRVNDTPDQDDQNFGCPTYPKISCGTSNMFMNYMDYTSDDCRNMFTNGQVTRMITAINQSRSGLLTAYSKCYYNLDAKLLNVVHPTDSICGTDVSPMVLLNNFGTTDITSGDFVYDIDGNSNTFHWTGSIAPHNSLLIGLPDFSGVSQGYHNLTVEFNNINGGATDNNMSNNQLVKHFYCYEGNSASGIPFSEGFDSGVFPPSNWDIYNPNNDLTWELTSDASGYSNSSYCTVIKNNAYTSNPLKRRDGLITDVFDLSNRFSLDLKFDVAYQARANKFDSLVVLYSTDCGVKWNEIWRDGGVTLSTSTDSVIPFIPTGTQWKTVNFSLDFLSTQKKVMFKFENISGWGNAIYLDNINLTGFANSIGSISEKVKVSLLPNPASDVVAVKLPSTHPFEKITVYNVLGERVMEKQIIDPISILHVSDLANGNYVIRLSSDKAVQSERLVIAR